MATKGSHKRTVKKEYTGPQGLRFKTCGSEIRFKSFIPANDHVKYDRIYFAYTKILETEVRGKIITSTKIGQELMLTPLQISELIRKEQAVELQ